MTGIAASVVQISFFPIMRAARRTRIGTFDNIVL